MGEKFKINDSQILYTQMDAEGVIFDTSKNEYYTLNEVSNTIFNLCAKGNSAEYIVAYLINEYQIDENQCINEVSKCINDFKLKGFIV